MLDVAQWEALAYDIALDKFPRHAIQSAYHLTDSELTQLLLEPNFDKLLEAKKLEIKALGADAEQAVKFRIIASRATKQFIERLSDPETSAKDFHTLFKTAVELAKLMPKEDEVATSSAHVVFNINGIPLLDHLQRQDDGDNLQPL